MQTAEGRAYGARRGAEYREAGGGGQLRRHAACRPFSRLGARARAERTWNMLFVVVTLDVSKLSGWLNAEAYCRVERRAWRMRCGARYSPGGVRAMWVAETQSACTGRARLKAVGTRGAHPEHVVHGRDLGRVEAERLVERRRELPNRKAGMQCGKRCGPGGVRALGGGDASGMCTGRARLKAVGARARAERTPNMPPMSVTLEGAVGGGDAIGMHGESPTQGCG